MIFFKRPHLLRRYSEPTFVRGYSTIPYTDIIFPMDVQTLEDAARYAEENDLNDGFMHIEVF